MANPYRGVVELQAGGETYRLSFSVNALCELEEQLDKPVAEIIASIQNPEQLRISSVRALIWAALRDHHDQLTIKDAGQITTDAGFQVAVAKVGEAIRLAFPEAKGKGNPRKAAAGG